MISKYISLIQLQPLVSMSVFATILPVSWIVVKKAYKEDIFQILFCYLLFKLIVDLIMFHYASQGRNTLVFFNLSIPIRYSLLALIFSQKISSLLSKRLILITIFLLNIFFLWDMNLINPDNRDSHNHQLLFYSATIESFLMISWILFYFKEIVQSLVIENLLTYPFFWICSGLLIYYSSLVFVVPIFHYATKWKDWIELGFMEYIPNVFEIVSMIFFCIGIHFWVNNDGKS